MTDPNLPPAFLPTRSTFWQPSFPTLERQCARLSPHVLVNLIRLLRLGWILALLPLHLGLVALHRFTPVRISSRVLAGANKGWTALQLVFYPLIRRILWALTGVGRAPDVGQSFQNEIPVATRWLGWHLGAGVAGVEREMVQLAEVARGEAWVRGEAVDPSGQIVPDRVPCFWVELRHTLKRPQESQDFETDPIRRNPRYRPQGGRVILYMAGGGYVFGHPTESSRCFSLACESGWPVLGVNYRKATHPSRAFPAALQDAITGYSHLVGLGFDEIVLAGDSAGAGLCISLTMHLAGLERDKVGGVVLPRGVVLYSPWVDLTLSEYVDGVSSQYEDDFVNPSGIATAVEHYLSHLTALPPQLRSLQPSDSPAHQLARHPLLSPSLPSSIPALQALSATFLSHATLGRPLKWLIFSGGAELFAPEIRALVANLRRANALSESGGVWPMEVEHVEEEWEVHGFPLVPGWVSPAAGRAIKKVGEFLADF